MIRQIMKIDEGLCNGCGICVDACEEGAIGMVDGVAKLLRDDYCDGLGNCLPVCPTGAISFEMREADAFDEAAVLANMEVEQPFPCGCPGSSAKTFERREERCSHGETPQEIHSELRQWPCQIKLVPINAPYFNGANLMIAADCTAFAHGDFHRKYMRNKITLIGCPKLDAGDYTEKLQAIITENDIKSVTIARMEVPCCSGLEAAAKNALKASGKFIPWQVVTVTTDGRILD